MQVPSDFPDRSVCILGLGYVGLTLAVTMAEIGFRVLGVEIRDDILESLNRNEPHFFEPGLAERMRHAIDLNRLSFAKRIDPKFGAHVYVITVGTPLGADGRVRTDSIEAVSTEIAGHVVDGDLVIMRSTVKIGTTRGIVVPILDRTSIAYDLAFCPERTLEGVAMTELRILPQIVGGMTMRANVRASQIFQFITPTVVRVSSIETAEMIKLVDNTQRDVHFAFANEIARMCDAIGIGAAEVIGAGKLGYPRTNLPMPGPVGGPCLEKDPHILVESLETFGITPAIAVAARRLNEAQPAETVAALAILAEGIPDFPAAPAITVAGLAFKGRPPTDDLRGTTAIPIIRAIRAHFPNAAIRGYDAVVAPERIRELGLDPCRDMADAFTAANLVVIANNHPGFADIAIEILAQEMARPGLVYDFWNHFSADTLSMPMGTGYVALGSVGRACLPKGTTTARSGS